MTNVFKDYFSENSSGYSQYRPHYPEPLFNYLSSICFQHHRAWDCATGTGQAASKLADYFDTIIATDASSSQIEQAIQNDRIIYQVATAEDTMIENNSIDLITVAQALHWFDINRFADEVQRVIREGGIVAAWTYNLFSINTDFDRILHYLYQTTLGPFWPVERKLVEEEYRNIQLPLKPVQPPAFEMTAQWTFSQVIGYLNTWSAVKKYTQSTGHNPVELQYKSLLKAWGPPEQVRTIRWPLTLKLWRQE